MTTEQRIKNIEKTLRERYIITVPGTALVRQLGPKDGEGVHWCLAIGGLGLPKRFFTGKSISECLKGAEDFLTNHTASYFLED